jgi:uncharacterized protein
MTMIAPTVLGDTLHHPSRSGRVHRLAALALLALACLFALIAPASAEPKFPPLTGRIVDEANLLSAADKAEILTMLRQLEGKSADQVVVYTTNSLQGYEIEEIGYRLGRFWKIGQGDISNGIILIVAPKDRKVRIEVGRGLEGTMTDLLSGTIIRNGILPAFRRGDFSAGVKEGVRDIKDVLLGDKAEVEKRARSIKPRQPATDWTPLIFLALFAVFFIFVSMQERKQAALQPSNMNRRRHGQQANTQRGSNNGGIVVVPGGWGGSGGWSGGSGSSGGNPDSGWSGGGGDFGGGGASDSW